MSDKSGSADDAAVLVSRKYLEELVRDAEAGRIFRACLNASAEIELDHLKKNPRSAEDVRRAALDSLAIIGLVFLVITVFAASRTANRMAIADVLRTGDN